jgi:hypothetical protein
VSVVPFLGILWSNQEAMRTWWRKVPRTIPNRGGFSAMVRVKVKVKVRVRVKN